MKSETDFLFNRKDTAEAMGVSTQAIGAWNLESVKKPGATGGRVYYDIRAVIQYRLNRDIEGGKSTVSLQVERSRLAKNQADKAELEVKKLKGELISANTIVAHWENMFLAFRAKILAIPQKAAIVALDATSLQDVEDSLRLFLTEALEELAGDGMPDEYKQVRQDSETGAQTATTTDSQQVGGQVQKTKRGGKRGARTVAD